MNLTGGVGGRVGESILLVGQSSPQQQKRRPPPGLAPQLVCPGLVLKTQLPFPLSLGRSGLLPDANFGQL